MPLTTSSVWTPAMPAVGGGVQARAATGGASAEPTGSQVCLILAYAVMITLVGRIFDIVLKGYHIPAILSTIAFVTFAFKGGFGVLTSRIGMPLVALATWMTIGIPFSTWRTGSLETTMDFVAYSLVALMVATGPGSLRSVARLLFLLAVLCVSQLVWTRENYDATRILGGATFGNSNDLGLLAAFSIPLWQFTSDQIKFIPARFVVKAVAAIFLLRTLALTGSRSAVVTALAILVASFVRTRGTFNKLTVVFLLVAGCLGIAITVPGQTLERLQSILTVFDDSAEIEQDEAQQSAAERRQLLKDSVRITIQHPLLGVGNGQFADYRWQEGVADGVRKGWLVTHEPYTQISSETGLLGAMCFVLFLWQVYKTVGDIRKLSTPDAYPDWKLGQSLATCLEVSMLSLAVSGMFMSIPQYVFWYLIGGLALAAERVVRHRLAQTQGSQPALAFVPAPSPLMIPQRVEAPAASLIRRIRPPRVNGRPAISPPNLR